jgi:hypothetical protein
MLLGLGTLPAQADAAWRKDPYTQGDEAAMKKAGYVSFGPFTWGDDHDSRLIDKMLPHARILWIETAHFKLGCALPPFRVPKLGKWKKKLQAELGELQQKLPDVNPKTRVLSPWLRAHLFAYRLEKMYAEVSRMLRVTDKDFPRQGEASRRGQYMGKGPHLGMPKKYPVLILTKTSDLMRYSQRAGSTVDPSRPAPLRLNFLKQGALFFGTAIELAKGALIDDKSLHCHVWFNVVHTLLAGYKHYTHALPAWCSEGLAHWYVLSVDPAEHVFTGIKGASLHQRKDPKWGLKIRKRVKNKDFEPMAKLMNKMSPSELTFGDHMASWSRVDFLLKKHPENFAKFMDRMKAPVIAAAGKAPTTEAILKRQDECFTKCIGMAPKAFDKAWTRFVLKTYPKR